MFSIEKQYFCQLLLQQIDEGDVIGSHYFKVNKVDYMGEDDQIIYGLWSRYNPFSILNYQQTTTNCYNLHYALEINTRKSNFLYYDCLDLEQKKIQKIIQYVDEEDEQHNFILDLDTYQYENTWYYFGVSLWIYKNKFELLILQNLNRMLYSSLGSKFPFYDSQLVLKFGGGLFLNDKQRVTTYKQNLLFFSFPGQLYFYSVEILTTFRDQEMHKFAIIDAEQCIFCFKFCQNQIISFDAQTLKFVDKDQKVTDDRICDYFKIHGWIKGINIKQSNQELLFKFIKISVNSESELKTNDNICPFQLLYRIQNEKLYLQIFTYSYNFPSINVDFSSNPFLIKKEFELELLQIYKWHFLSVSLQENQFIAQITFYEKENQYQINFNTQVHHFQNIQFKVSVGNIVQNKNNYIEMKIFALTLISEQNNQQEQTCDSSCQSCEGPTKQDGLSCKQDSLRIYLPEIQSCVCPQNLLDHSDGTCKEYKNLQFSLIEQEKILPKCQYGYFRYDELTCVQCPSNPNTNTIFCLNCLQNPLTWKSNPVCETIIKYNDSDTLIYHQENEYDTEFINFYYIFDNENIKFCIDCDEQSLLSFDQIYSDYLKTFNKKIKFPCQIYGCVIYQTTLEKCEYTTTETKCIYFEHQQSKVCLSPYYLNSRKICQLCGIENCIYCFEYSKNDFSKSTLYKDFDTFIIDEFHSIGCALCSEGYQFNFLLNKCVNELPKILNCKRSFINLEGIEICTLADSQSFEIAPEIINCQWKIKNCYSCVKTSFQILMCTLCEDGYTVNIFSGQCQQCYEQHSKKCIQGSVEFYDGWVQLVQSFIMLFLNNNYFYPNSLNTFDQIISCDDGYKISQINTCEKYCNADGLECQELLDPPYGYYCISCPLNYYSQPSRSTDQENCIQCPKLCSICQSRTPDEISQVNPYFIVTEDNVQFTHKCIQQIQRSDVYIDSELLIAKLFLEDKNKILNYDVPLIQHENQQLYFSDKFINQQNSIDYLYCNQIGIDSIQITFQFESKIGYIELKSFNVDNMIENTLKQYIFSLKLIIFNLIGLKQQLNLFTDHLIIKSFDYINITKIDFFVINPNYFIFYNDQPIYLTIQNCTFQNQKAQIYSVFNINSTYSKFITLNNLTFQNLYLIDSIIFNISGEYNVHILFLPASFNFFCYF